MQPNNPPTPPPPPRPPPPTHPRLTRKVSRKGVTQEHPAEEEEGSRAGEHMKREVALNSRHGLPNAVMHDVKHVDADSEAGAGPS